MVSEGVEVESGRRLDLNPFLNLESESTSLWCGLLIIWTNAEFQNLFILMDWFLRYISKQVCDIQFAGRER